MRYQILSLIILASSMLFAEGEIHKPNLRALADLAHKINEMGSNDDTGDACNGIKLMQKSDGITAVIEKNTDGETLLNCLKKLVPLGKKISVISESEMSE